jgi:hypothetical protein
MPSLILEHTDKTDKRIRKTKGLSYPDPKYPRPATGGYL